MARKTAVQKDSLTIALRFLSTRPRSVAEVAGKLAGKGFQDDEIKKTMDSLLRAGYLDDEKFAGILIRSRVRTKNWGTAKISAELNSKGVSAGIIQKALGSLSRESEEETAANAFKKWLKKSGAPSPLDKAGFAKAFRHLKWRGFSSSTIFKVLNYKGPEDE